MAKNNDLAPSHAFLRPFDISFLVYTLLFEILYPTLQLLYSCCVFWVFLLYFKLATGTKRSVSEYCHC